MTIAKPSRASCLLFLISAVILFFELVCIRWLASYVLYLGYFTNFVLLGALLGIGAGALLAGRATRLITWLPLLLICFFPLILVTRAQVNPDYEEFVYFTANIAAISLPAYVLLPIIFIGVTAIFTLLSQELGTLLNSCRPLRAYTINIAGSLAGIAAFTFLSFISAPAWSWFLIASLGLVPFLRGRRRYAANLALLAVLVAIILASDLVFVNLWSPYSRLNLLAVNGSQATWVDLDSPDPHAAAYALQAGGAGHQEFTGLANSKPFYRLPYSSFCTPPVFENALIIGAGGGNDVAFALANGVTHIDAVEIDPVIVKLGQRFHPEAPYRDPRVDLHTDDARAFLERTDATYDLVIFALPDSLVLTTTSSSIRLESYLFTSECFTRVRDILRPDGLLVFYNYYRYEWLVDKISSMLAAVFGKPPIMHRFQEPLYAGGIFATFFAGPRAAAINTAPPEYSTGTVTAAVPATDDWPFLYLKEPSLPSFYSLTLLIILVSSFTFIRKIAPPGAIHRHGLPFFFMGAAFTLLEAKSIVQFLLLFGSTWMVNALVFFAILTVVLIANGCAARFRFQRLGLLYLLLLLALLANFIIPLKLFLGAGAIVRYGLATLFLFSPILFANLIYSATFRDTASANVAYGANLLGTMVGGAAEYLSLQFGYQNLIIIAALFYFFAFYAFTRMKKETA